MPRIPEKYFANKTFYLMAKIPNILFNGKDEQKKSK